MKYLLVLTMLSTPVFALKIPKMNDVFSKEMAKKVMDACKEDKSKLSGCESYTEFSPLKECLMKNKDALSATCKNALTLSK